MRLKKNAKFATYDSPESEVVVSLYGFYLNVKKKRKIRRRVFKESVCDMVNDL